MSDDIDTDQLEDQDDEQLDPETVDLTAVDDLVPLRVAELREEAERERARALLAETVEAKAGFQESFRALEARAEEIEEWGSLSADDSVLPDTEITKEIARRDAIAAAERAERERLDRMSEEEKATLAAQEAADKADQDREDQLQSLLDATQEALHAPDIYSQKRQVNIFESEGEGGRHMITVTEGEGDEATSHDGLAPAFVQDGFVEAPDGKPVPRWVRPPEYEPSYKKATRERVGAFHVKDLADQLSETPPGGRTAFWRARSQVERDALSRMFGLRPALTSADLGEEA